MDLEQEEKDDFNMLVILLWPVWVPVVLGAIYLFFLIK